MKTDFYKYRAVLILCAALGWWGLWFPELAVWSDAVVVREENASVQQEENVIEWETAQTLYRDLMQADRDQIQVRSRLLEWISGMFER